jgi:hypothetical protein
MVMSLIAFALITMEAILGVLLFCECRRHRSVSRSLWRFDSSQRCMSSLDNRKLFAILVMSVGATTWLC